jgi:hypothetical protein
VLLKNIGSKLIVAIRVRDFYKILDRYFVFKILVWIAIINHDPNRGLYEKYYSVFSAKSHPPET